MQISDDISREILGLEQKYRQAMQDHDLDTAIALTDFPCVVASAHGLRSVSQQEFEKMFNSQDQECIRSVRLDQRSAEVRLITPETAMIAYGVPRKFTHDGKSKDLKAFDSSTWVKRGDKWVCAMHTEIELSRAQL